MKKTTGPMAFMRGLTFPGGQLPVLTGEKVYLRYPRMSDYQPWCFLRAESRDFLTPWEPTWTSDELSRGAFRRRIRRYQKEARQDTAYAFFIFRQEDDKLVGGCSLSNVRRGVAETCFLGYWMGERFARRGYMFDAVNELIPFVFNVLHLHRIEASCLPVNTASRSLLHKAGFREEGVAKQYLRINGVWQDHVRLALLAEDAGFR